MRSWQYVHGRRVQLVRDGLIVDGVLLRGEQRGGLSTAPFVRLGNVSDIVDLDLSVDSVFECTPIGAIAFVLLNPLQEVGVAQMFTVKVNNPSAFSVTWPTSVDWGDDDPADVPAQGLAVYGFLSTDSGATWIGLVLFTGDDG